VTAQEYDAYERVIRGAYRNVPDSAPGLCQACTAPTSGVGYTLCVPCETHSSSPHQLARGGVIPLSWAPMDSQGYQDLRQYKESSGTPEQIARLKILFALAMKRHGDCIAKPDPSSPVGIAHVPSTSGERQGVHPLAAHVLPMFSPDRPRVTPLYVGPLGGDRNARRFLHPEHWELPDLPASVSRVLVIDDSWVSGGHAQSVGAAFEREGVAARIIVLGRVLDPSRQDQGSYLRAHEAAPFDSAVCPVHRLIH
jgi:hypothetical protein